jgi:hypothetical protein
MSARGADDRRDAIRARLELIVAHVEYDIDRVTSDDARSPEFIAAVGALADAARQLSSVREGAER